MLVRLSIVLTLLALVLVAPFALRPPSEEGVQGPADRRERVVIITPHNESIQTEFERAFVEHMEKEHGRAVAVDWRQPGGTSEIARFLGSEYANRFELHWKRETGLPFTRRIREAFPDDGLDERLAALGQQGWMDDPTLLREASPEERELAARYLFLQSDVGVGLDLFFGGGAYDFSKQADAGTLVARDAGGDWGPAAVRDAHPGWFEREVMPASVSGEPFRDPQFRWVGTVLSAFGICYNVDVLERLGFEGGLKRWDDLADPRLAGQVALADPTKSGSTTKAFEMLIQERMQRVRREQSLSEEEAVRRGWNEAMRLILRISANSRYFTDSAAKVPRDIARGDAAAGMCIDFYGRTFNELNRRPDGSSHVRFVMPRAGTSIGADPIGMLRGAPHPELAHRFVEFVLSMEGQKLWNYRPGAPGGPHRFALRRPPIRRDFYTEEHRPHRTDPEVNPYEIAAGFTYRPEWTGSLFTALRYAIRSACIDPHPEQRRAWEALIAAGLPPEGVARFETIETIDYDSIVDEIAPTLATGDKVAEVELARELAEVFRERYRKVIAEWAE